MNAASELVLVGAGVKVGVELLIFAVIAAVVLGRSPRLRHGAIRLLRPWRDGEEPSPLVLYALVVLAAVGLTALVVTSILPGFGPRL